MAGHREKGAVLLTGEAGFIGRRVGRALTAKGLRVIGTDVVAPEGLGFECHRADARDTATFAQPEVARVTHVDLDLALDFAARAVGGTATLDVLAAPGANELILDSNGLKVTRITDLTVGQIAHRVGYDDQPYFSRAFKRHAGVAPQAFRERRILREFRELQRGVPHVLDRRQQQRD